ncbi:MAG: 2-C-methyl-D-erythritol 4-phosphate cytidylyltransferase [Candidatus Saganbacteria bacterium]|nr:2-C-methyl-D-erythritol 4-phosphate cytidylyltransferase [Candidatus Saganbacteria bacterium]
MKTTAIIAAGGLGTRMRSPDGKLFIEICGKPVLGLTIKAFENSEIIDDIILVVALDEIEKARKLKEREGYKKIRHIIQGGASRQASVYNGLQVVSDDTDIVVIHDGARPFVTKEIILEAVSETRAHRAVIVGVPVKDTIKTVKDDRLVSNTLDREILWQVQTPQVFDFKLIKEAYERANRLDIQATDDARLVERLGEKVKMISGSYDNIKITTPEDLMIAEAILRSKQS